MYCLTRTARCCFPWCPNSNTASLSRRGSQKLRALHNTVHDLHKRLTHILPRLGAGLAEAGTVARSQLLALSVLDRARRRFVQLAAHQVHDGAGDGVVLDLVEPALHGHKALPVGDVVDEDHAVRTAVVAVRQRPEALLAGRVEEVQLVRLAVDGELLALFAGRRDQQGRIERGIYVCGDIL
jgi:hypothetical protein